MAGIKWTKEEDDFLINNYENLDKEVLLNTLSNRTWEAIKIRAEKFKIRRYNNVRRFANLDVLLKDTTDVYYWIGFILADGNIKNNRLRIRLSIKDSEHLEKFKNFIKFEKELKTGIDNRGYSYIGISIKDTKYLNILCNKFNIRHNKTYYQSNISEIKDKELLLSMIIGFIDGDGNITHQNKRKDFKLTIKCHKSWFNNLNYILKEIQEITQEYCKTEVRLTKDKRYAMFTITNTNVLKKLKNRMLSLNIPYMERKWNVIDDKYETFYERKKKRLNQYIKIIKDNPCMRVKDIANIMNISEEVVYKYRKEIKKELMIV